jgi:hypothetical protein
MEQLEAEWRRLRRLEKRRRRIAMAVYLAAGGAFGTCIYLARTRLHSFVGAHTWPFFLGLVVLSVILFVLATRYEGDARKVAERKREVEEKIDRQSRR